jgi:hypothetical protein
LAASQEGLSSMGESVQNVDNKLFVKGNISFEVILSCVIDEVRKSFYLLNHLNGASNGRILGTHFRERRAH